MSTEFVAVIGISFLSLGIAWIVGGPRFAISGRNAGLCFLGCVSLAVVIERGSRWVEIEYDRISLVYVALALVIVLVFFAASRAGTTRGAPTRVAIGITVSALGLASLQAIFPGVLRGPWAPIDPAIRRIWLDHVAELQPLFPGWGGDLSLAVIYLGGPLAGLTLAIAFTVRRPKTALPWVPILIGAPIFLLLAFRYARFAPHAEIFGAFPLLWGLDRGLRRADSFTALPRLVTRLGLVVSSCLGFLVLGAFLPASPSESEDTRSVECNLQDLAQYLNDPGSFENRPRTILANIDFGSELLYRTNDRVIATPIRQQDAILDTYIAFTTTDLAESKRIIDDRQVDLVLLCPSHDRYLFGDPPPEGSLDDALLNDRVPEWLTPVTLPGELSAFRLFVTRP